MNVTGVFQQTVMPSIHFILNLRYNSFEKYMIDRWEDPCGYLNGTGYAPVFEILYDNFRHLLSWHACPFRKNQLFTILSERFAGHDYSIDPDFPAGKYRFDVLIASGHEKLFVMSMAIYFTLTDHGVWY